MTINFKRKKSTRFALPLQEVTRSVKRLLFELFLKFLLKKNKIIQILFGPKYTDKPHGFLNYRGKTNQYPRPPEGVVFWRPATAVVMREVDFAGIALSVADEPFRASGGRIAVECLRLAANSGLTQCGEFAASLTDPFTCSAVNQCTKSESCPGCGGNTASRLAELIRNMKGASGETTVDQESGRKRGVGSTAETTVRRLCKQARKRKQREAAGGSVRITERTYLGVFERNDIRVRVRQSAPKQTHSQTG
ncbi:hypothetical protein Y032_0070g433 [Ancylostoma ceylanicum]|uniref:Uncharacterized protein n=1 Tax=Ancylostoma ceylanicum TaxID=53326 RepID=A0A016TWL7_9BILA|nr:hypothetical protein Y032_0070g433 [Ancylostoma ceylanicum]